jgi:transcriptional regulator with XRE-family HTH domain
MMNMTEQATTELGRFLRARREGVRPADAGLPPGTSARRTPGLRREEIATLAGMSIDYYTRLERGRETRPSPAVVDALARALRLDGDEHEYLKSLAAQAARRAPVPPRPPSRAVRPTARLLLETLRPNPAYVVSRTYDILAANPGGARLHPGLLDWPPRQRNTIRYTFLHPEARDLWPDWEQKARGCVAQLRAVAGSDPDAPDLAALVGELLGSPLAGTFAGVRRRRSRGQIPQVVRELSVGIGSALDLDLATPARPVRELHARCRAHAPGDEAGEADKGHVTESGFDAYLAPLVERSARYSDGHRRTRGTLPPARRGSRGQGRRRACRWPSRQRRK